MSAFAGQVSGLNTIDGRLVSDNPTTRRPGALKNGRRYTVVVRVHPEGETASVEALLDGLPCVDWKGKGSSFGLSGVWEFFEPGRLYFGGYGTGLVLHQARIRLLKGKAYWLPASLTPAEINPGLPEGATLLMSFQKDSLRQLGNRLHVQDLSGSGNCGLGLGVAYTPQGKVGGGLALNGGFLRLPRTLLAKKPAYTIAAWIRRQRHGDSLIFGEYAPGIVGDFNVHGTKEQGRLCIHAWNQHRPDNWSPAGMTPLGSVAADRWVFVAAVVSDAGTSTGQAKMFVDEADYSVPVQQVDHEWVGFVEVRGGPGTQLDELAFFPRALSDQEIRSLYQMGLQGEVGGEFSIAALPTPPKPPTEVSPAVLSGPLSRGSPSPAAEPEAVPRRDGAPVKTAPTPDLK